MPSTLRTRGAIQEGVVEREARRAAERAVAELKKNSRLTNYLLQKSAETGAKPAARNAAAEKPVTGRQADARRAGNAEQTTKKEKKKKAEAAKTAATANRKPAPDARSEPAATAPQEAQEGGNRIPREETKATARSNRRNRMAQLESSAAIFSTLLEGIQEGVAHLSTDGAILYANPRFLELLGAQPEKAAEDNLRLKDFLSADCWKELDEGLKMAAREPVEGSLRVEDPQGQGARTIGLALGPVQWRDAVTIRVVAAEMTDAMQRNQELQEKEDSLHALSSRILQLQDEERRRIARDLHDITGQELAVVIMQLMQVAKQRRMDAEAEKGITDAASLVKKVEENIRTLSYVLHPPLLDELGLGAALNWYVEGFTKRSGIHVKVELAQQLPRLTHEKEMALFRVVQEALTNVLRHSGSHTARIVMTSDEQTVVLIVEDEGKGVPRKRFGSAEKEHGVGIAGMRERMQQLGGSLEVRALVRGTQVVAKVPIGQAEPIEPPLTESEILKVAKALGYQAEAAATASGQGNGGQAARAAQPARESQTSGAAATDPAVAKKRVLIADDHEVTRQGICSLLKSEKDIEICGEAKDGFEALIKAKELVPDLIIMDLTMPGGGGFAAANRIRQLKLCPKILFFTTHSNREIERLARLGGFDGFVQKTDAARDLVRGVRAVLQGDRFFGAEVLKVQGGGKGRRFKWI